MESITSLFFSLPSNIKHEIKLEKKNNKRTPIYVVHPIWATSRGRVASSIILKIDLQDYMESSHMHHNKFHHPIMCVQMTYTTCDV